MSLRRLPLPLGLACIVALTILHLGVNGYSFGGSNGRPASPSSDHANIIPWVHFYQDPSLFPHDAAIRMKASYATVLWRGVALLSRLISVQWAFFLLHALTLAATYAMIFFIARRGSSADAAGLLACLFFVLVWHGPAGVDTHDPALYTRTAALPVGLGALWLLLARRPVLAAAVLGATYCIHPLTAFYVATIAVPFWLLRGEIPWLRRLLPLVLLVLLVAASSWAIGDVGPMRLGPPSTAWLELQLGNNAMHLFPWMWGGSVWRDLLMSVLFLMPPLLWPGEMDDRRLALSALLAAAGLLALGWTTTAWLPSMVFMQLQPLRGLQMTILVSLILAARWLAARLSPARSPNALFTVPAAMIAVCGLVAHQNLVAATGLALVLIGERNLRYRFPIILASLALLLASVVRDNQVSFVQTVPGALWPFGGTGAVSWCLFLILLPALVSLVRAPFRERALCWGIAFVAVLAFGLTAVSHKDPSGMYYRPEVDYPWRDPTNPWIDVQRWVAVNTPRDAFILNPPYLEGFRTFSRRSQFVDWKQGTLSMFNEPFGVEWLQRMQRIVRRPLDSRNAWRNVVLNYESLPAKELDGLFRQYGLTHMITASSAKNRPLPWRELYSNGAFRVLETGVPPPPR